MSLTLASARDVAGRVLGRLQREPGALRLAVTGALRRMDPVLEAVDLLATAYEPEALLEAFVDPGTCAAVLEHGDNEARIRLKDDTEVRLHVLPLDDAHFFALLTEGTGGAEHLAALREQARSHGLRLDATGLFRGADRVDLASEQELYAHLGVPWRPPELRLDADLSAVPDDLVAMDDVRGLCTLRLPAESPFSLYDLVTRAAQEGYAWVVADAPAADIAAVQADVDDAIRIFPYGDVGAALEIREGEEPTAAWHAEARQRGAKVLTTAVIERPSDVDKAIAAVGAARRGIWRAKDVLTTLDADAFAAWCGMGAR